MNRFLEVVERWRDPYKLVVLALLFVAALNIAALFSWLGPCAGGTPMPAPLRAELQAFDAGAPKVVATIASEKQNAAASDATSKAHDRHARAHQDTAARDGRLADSLAIVAIAAKSAADSASAWHAAYNTRTAEVSSLRLALAEKDSAFRDQQHRGDTLGVALVKSDSLFRKADSLMKAVVHVAESGCRVPGTFGLIGCPSRRVTFVAGAVLALVAVKHGDELTHFVRSSLP